MTLMEKRKRRGQAEGHCMIMVLGRSDADEEGERGVDRMKPIV